LVCGLDVHRRIFASGVLEGCFGFGHLAVLHRRYYQRDDKMITEAIKKIIEENPIALATVDENNKPNVIGVAYVKVVNNNQVIITDNYMKQTKENLNRNNNVCLAVWDKNWNGYKLIGTAEYFTSGKWKEFIEKIPENKGLSVKGAILVAISQLIKLG